MAKRDFVPGLGALLKAARERSALTQDAVATSTGVSRSNLSAYESDAKTPTLAVLYKLATAYGVPVAELLPVGTTETDMSDSAPPAPKKGKKK